MNAKQRRKMRRVGCAILGHYRFRFVPLHCPKGGTNYLRRALAKAAMEVRL